MDGLLLNTEDLYTQCTNKMLAKYGRPSLPWSVKAQLQGRPGPSAAAIFHEWAKLPIPTAQYHTELTALQMELFPSAQPLPGVELLLRDLARAKVHMALATSSHAANFALKTRYLQDLFAVFDARRRVLGDDTRIPHGRGKPAPDIYLLALDMVNETLPPGEPKIAPEECLVFEDSVPGVEAGRRAGMRVVWCPHSELKKEFTGREDRVLAGQADEGGEMQVRGESGVTEGRGEIGDGWAQYLQTLERFPYASYGIVVPTLDQAQKL
ncbi:MAG: hypothetical protein M1818_001181 [Claussenomyces sp. TS43310]|nr:MAG: hypothetical protein M1818_001181 [Claussenomyces sp. TS43310]